MRSEKLREEMFSCVGNGKKVERSGSLSARGIKSIWASYHRPYIAQVVAQLIQVVAQQGIGSVYSQPAGAVNGHFVLLDDFLISVQIGTFVNKVS